MGLDSSIKVLLVMEQCNPEWPSVPLVGYQFFKALKERVAVTLVTHGRNQAALEQQSTQPSRIVYLHESQWTRLYYKLATAWLPGGLSNWPLYHVLTYPIYAQFNGQVYQQFQGAVAQGDYDIVHVMTPMMPRYPVKLSQACGSKTPFLLGPVNGGIPFPKGFQSIANQEFAYLNGLRRLGRWLIPGYVQTYRQADRILSGSTYTQGWIQTTLGIPGDRLALLSENGLEAGFFAEQTRRRTLGQPLHLLFVGRLVPYKAADLIIEALHQLPPADQAQVQLTIVGEGPQRPALAQLIADRNLGDRVRLTGWVPQGETRHFYAQADVFCFPSLREFGGAVVLEAMAAGLPCIVTDYGGIGEYVTPEAGFKIAPQSRDYLIQQMGVHLQTLLHQPTLYEHMSKAALARAQTFRWEAKAEQVLAHYQALIRAKSGG